MCLPHILADRTVGLLGFSWEEGGFGQSLACQWHQLKRIRGQMLPHPKVFALVPSSIGRGSGGPWPDYF